MSQSEAPLVSIDPAEIKGSEVPRRSFLRGFGVVAGTAALTTQTACAALFSGSDSCTATDPYDTSDNDPYDPIGQGGDPRCDSD